MEYVFFDTEFIPHKDIGAKLCSFGYVVCNEGFDILEKDDIIINPGIDIENVGTLITDGFKYAYPYAVFSGGESFSEVYQRIKSLLTREDAVVIGHSAVCDVCCLMKDIEFYGLSPFDFLYLDIQKMHSYFANSKKLSLSKLCGIYGVLMLCEHKSDDDAEMTAMVCKRICERYMTSPKKMTKNRNLIGAICKGEVHDDLSSAFPLVDTDKMTPGHKRLFRRYLSSEYISVNEDKNFCGKKFCFDENFERGCVRKLFFVIDALRKKGAVYTSNVRECEVFVDFSKTLGVRASNASSLHKKVLSGEDLLKSLGLPTTLPEVSDAEIDSIIGSTEAAFEWLQYYINTFGKLQ